MLVRVRFKAHILTFYILIILYSVTACQSRLDRSFEEIVDLYNPNSEITLTALSEVEDFSSGSDIDIIIENKTSNYIYLASNYGVNLFVYLDDESEWIEVENLVHVYPEEPRILCPENDLAFSRDVFSVKPAIQKTDESLYMRILVIGNILDGDFVTDQQVSAYLDVELIP